MIIKHSVIYIDIRCAINIFRGFKFYYFMFAGWGDSFIANFHIINLFEKMKCLIISDKCFYYIHKIGEQTCCLIQSLMHYLGNKS